VERSLVRKEILPFLALFALLLLGAIVGDRLLHEFGLVWVGRWLGIPGTLLILLSFLYSLRKRKRIAFGRPGTLLTLHESLAWLGVLMILVHAGILALAAMLVNVISGMTGKVLLDRSRRFLGAKRQAYEARGLGGDEIERRLFWDATAFDLMKKWRAVHLPITLAFAVLGLGHILTILLFWQWR